MPEPEEFVLPENKILIATSVDFARKVINRPIYITQYDNKLSIFAVSLYMNGNRYSVLEDLKAKIRFGLKHGLYVYEDAIGYSDDRDVAYFDIDSRMTHYDGTFFPIIEIIESGELEDNVVGSSQIVVVVAKNPIQIGDVEAAPYYLTTNFDCGLF